MSDETKKPDPEVKVGRTPQGQWALETPRTSAPGSAHDLFGAYYGYIGNPMQRYGRRTSAMNVPMRVKLEMLAHPVIAMCCGFISATLVKARREVRCKDESKRRFIEATFRYWEREFILQAAVGIALGSIGLIKRWTFRTPEPVKPEDPPVWKGKATPFIIKGFDMCHPLSSEPKFDKSGRTFQGMRVADGNVDVFNSLWLTFRQAWSFGAYKGAGRLAHAYNDWWMAEFGRDNYLIAMQKRADKVAKVGYPSGVDPATGRSYQAIALEIGDNVRSGATVALPTDVYKKTDPATGAMEDTGVTKWTLDFLDGTADFGAFHNIDDHHAQRMSLGLFVPPQAFLNVKQSALGGPTTADVLADFAVELLMQDAADIDRHLNKYVLPALSRANFPQTSPRAEIVTVGLESDNRAELYEIFKGLMGQHEDMAYFDFRDTMKRLELPMRSEEDVEKARAAQAKAQKEAQARATKAPKEEPKAAAAEDDKKSPVGDPLPEPEDDTANITVDDVAAAVVDWFQNAPEEARGILFAVSEEDED